MKNLLLIFTFLLGFQAYSNHPGLSSDSLKTLVLQQIGIKETELKEDLWAEKVLPYATTQTVMVIPQLVEENEMEGTFEVNAIVVLINNQTGKIIQLFEESNTYYSDATYLSKFVIDTAPFMLTKERRAFGIRAQFYGRSSNPYSEELISLFIPEGKALRRVLKNELISTVSEELNRDCNGGSHSMHAVILFETKTTHNYYNLVIKESYATMVHEKIKGECEEKITEKKEKKRVLLYDGTTYH